MTFFLVSVIVAYAGGIIALFAPCCVSYLLPAYLGAVIKEKSRRIVGTLLFTLGIATLMVPTTLGFWAFMRFFENNHTLLYVIGGSFMIALGLLSLTGVKLPLPMVQLPQLSSSSTLWSFYPLGLLSGLTSICCAPVLAGAMTLGALTPNFLQSITIALAYTLGIVTPLFLGSFVLEMRYLHRFRQWLVAPLFGRPRSDIIAGTIFLLMGIATIYLVLTDRIAMPDMTSNFGAKINGWIINVSQRLSK